MDDARGRRRELRKYRRGRGGIDPVVLNLGREALVRSDPLNTHVSLLNPEKVVFERNVPVAYEMTHVPRDPALLALLTCWVDLSPRVELVRVQRAVHPQLDRNRRSEG